MRLVCRHGLSGTCRAPRLCPASAGLSRPKGACHMLHGTRDLKMTEFVVEEEHGFVGG
jgi:hypothetical protein